ncbi:hypothetical protein R6Q59_000263 [Mikania micrantha]
MFISRRKHEPAHYMLKIESFSLLYEAETFKIESDVFEASGHKWRLDLHPNKDGHISLHVVICDTGNDSKGWEVCVDVSFFVYDQMQNNYVTFQDMNGRRTRFNEKKTTWGFDKLIAMESFMECKNGYLFNDSCVFGVEIFEVPEFTRLDRCLLMTKPPETMNSFTWTINRFSDLTDNVVSSEVFKVGKVKWKLLLYPKGNKSGAGTHLSVYLGVHDVASFPDGWKLYAKFNLRVKNQCTKSDTENETDNWFCNSAKDWGYSSFMLLSELSNSETGFLLNDNLMVEAKISVMGTLRHFI